MDMCQLLSGTKATVNMDNYFMLTTTAIKLHQTLFFVMKLYALIRGCWLKAFYLQQKRRSNINEGIQLFQ